MKAAIISNLVTDNVGENQKRILQLASRAIDNGAEFILFPEVAATGLINSGNPQKDYGIAETIPGPRNSEWSRFAAEHGTYFGAGLLEREEDRIFDSAVLYNPEGELALHYRRNDPGWHNPDDEPTIYCEGTQIPVVKSAIGRLAFLICGDLWNDKVQMNIKRKELDYLLYIFARDTKTRERTKTEWDTEIIEYERRWRKLDANILATNLFFDHSKFGSIGGAWYLSKTKQIVTAPILQENVLIVEL